MGRVLARIGESRAQTDAALAHFSKAPEPPSTKAPRGWVTRDVDQFVLGLLAKEPERRPKSAAALLDQVDGLGRGPSSIVPTGRGYPEDRLSALIDALIAVPED